jgi:tetratricopeptide (TPR) repeat protein
MAKDRIGATGIKRIWFQYFAVGVGSIPGGLLYVLLRSPGSEKSAFYASFALSAVLAVLFWRAAGSRSDKVHATGVILTNPSFHRPVSDFRALRRGSLAFAGLLTGVFLFALLNNGSPPAGRLHSRPDAMARVPAYPYYQRPYSYLPPVKMPDYQGDLSVNLAVLSCEIVSVDDGAQLLREREADCKKSLNHFRQLAKKDRAYTLDIAVALNGLGKVYSQTERTTEAEDAYLKALHICNSAPRNLENYPPMLATTWFNLGGFYADTQRPNQAESAYKEALDIYRHQVKAEAYRPSIAAALNNLGILYESERRPKEAEADLQEALSIYRKMVKADSPLYLSDLATTLNNLGVAYTNTRHEEAEADFQEALDIYRHDEGAQKLGLARTLRNIGVLYANTQRTREAEGVYQEALAIYRQQASDKPAYQLDFAATLNNLGVLYRNTQRVEEAKASFREALKAYRQMAKAHSSKYQSDLARTLVNLGTVCRDTQQFEEADASYQEALGIYRELAETNQTAYRPYIAYTLGNLAISYFYGERTDKAKEAGQEMLGIYRELARDNQAYRPYVTMSQTILAGLEPGAPHPREIEAAFQQPFGIESAQGQVTQMQQVTASR